MVIKEAVLIFAGSGVSCDGCMAPNFTGDRYKCLRCYDFDLCARCYAEERKGKKERSRDTNSMHQTNHPMQCIMTQQDFGINFHTLFVA